MFGTISHNRFVANANKGFKNAVANIIIKVYLRRHAHEE